MSDSTQNNNTDITLSEVPQKKGQIKMMKYHVFIIIVALVVIGFIVIVGKFGSNGLAFFIFITFLLIPVIVMYGNKLPNYIPGPLGSLISGNEVEKPNKKSKKIVSKMGKQIFMIVSIILLITGCIILMSNINNDLKHNVPKEISLENETFTRIMMSLLCAIIAGVLLLKLTYI